MKNIAVFASGFGSNFQAIIDAVDAHTLDANIALLVSDKPNCKAVERANTHGIDAFVFSSKDYENKEAYETAILQELQLRNVDYIILAGYMRFIGKVLLQHYPNKIINLHPALLPSFAGAHGIEDAYRYGVKVFGITIHFVDEGMDTGDIRTFFPSGSLFITALNSLNDEEERALASDAFIPLPFLVPTLILAVRFLEPVDFLAALT